MEKFIKKISYIEIGILIACVIFMFFPFIYINVGSIDTTANAWHTIFGIDKSTTGITSFSSFSILCLLVYILLFIIFLLLVFFDNQANVLIDLVKIVLFLGTGFMFIFYLRLISYNEYFSSYNEVKKFISPRPGNYLSAIACFIGAVLSVIEFVNDIKAKKD